MAENLTDNCNSASHPEFLEVPQYLFTVLRNKELLLSVFSRFSLHF